MTVQDDWNGEQAPFWLDHAIDTADPVPEAQRAKLDRFKADFQALLRRAEAVRKDLPRETDRAGAVRAVFSLAGRLIEAARGAIEVDTDLRLAPATRSVGGGPLKQPRTPVSMVAFPADDVCIEVTHHRDDEATILSVNLRDRATGKEIRPFTIRILDQDRNELIPSERVNETDLPPGFPDPQPGDYLIEIAWDNGSTLAELRYE